MSSPKALAPSPIPLSPGPLTHHLEGAPPEAWAFAQS